MEALKTQNKNQYNKLVGLTVAVRDANKNSIDYKIVKIKEHYTIWFLDIEEKAYSISDIVMIF